MRTVSRGFCLPGLLALLAALPGPAAAQGRQAAGQTVPRARSAQTAPSVIPVSQRSSVAVPGLGFDYPHLAAVGGNRGGAGAGEITVSDPPRHGNRGGAWFTPVFLGGFAGVSHAAEPEQPQERPQPQIIVIQQAAPAAPVPPAAPLPAAVQNDATLADGLAAGRSPVREIGEFILVRRDGGMLFAAAYSIIGANMRWISREGLRNTLPLAEINAETTAAMNEARGVTLQLQN